MSYTTSSNDEPRPAIGLMRKLSMEPDPWQAEVLQEDYHHLLLNCCRQAGKSTVVAMLELPASTLKGSQSVSSYCF